VTQEEWQKMGFNSWVAEALEGRELSEEYVRSLDERAILDEVFEWHGFIGFTGCIVAAVDNVRNMAAHL
jgi:hypothetical protein